MTEQHGQSSDWSPLLRELEERRKAAMSMGGAEKTARHNADGRLDARGRIDELVDAGSFTEFGMLVGGIPRGGQTAAPADAIITGMATIEGRPVLVGSEDFTVKGGSIGLGAHAKRLRLALLAAQERVPLVMLLEGAGERTTNSLERYPYAPNDLQALVELSGKVPTVAVVMGASAGHGALTAMLMDFVIMVRGAAIFSAGPPLVAAATGQQVTKEELGGTDIHVRRSGVAHNVAENDKAALRLVRRYLGYLPTNAWQLPPRLMPSGDGERRLEGILGLIPRDLNRGYDVRKVVGMLADADTVQEIQPLLGQSMVTSLARLGGRPVAIVANQPLVRSGAIDSEAANKAARFLQIADAFHLPVIFLADNPGVMAGTDAERSGALRYAARMYKAQAEVRSPKLHVTLRKAYGFGSSLMAMNPFDQQTVSLAFPGATLGAMPAEGGGKAAGADSEMQAALSAAEIGGTWGVADTMGYDEVIDPRDLRNVLLAALELASGREGQGVEPRSNGIWP